MFLSQKIHKKSVVQFLLSDSIFIKADSIIEN